MYLTMKQRNKIEKAAKRHGWTLSRECRYRIQTTLDNELDFFDQELLMMNRCRNAIDKVGRNFHYIILNDQARVLDKDGFYQDAEKLETEIINLKSGFENNIIIYLNLSSLFSTYSCLCSHSCRSQQLYHQALAH